MTQKQLLLPIITIVIITIITPALYISLYIPMIILVSKTTKLHSHRSTYHLLLTVTQTHFSNYRPKNDSATC